MLNLGNTREKPSEADKEMLKTLVEIGFPLLFAQKALIETFNNSVQEAVDWMVAVSLLFLLKFSNYSSILEGYS